MGWVHGVWGHERLVKPEVYYGYKNLPSFSLSQNLCCGWFGEVCRGQNGIERLFGADKSWFVDFLHIGDMDRTNRDMARLFLQNCEPGDTIEDVFVLGNKQLSTTSSGKLFIKAFVSDRTAQITARLWNATREIFAALPENGFVYLRGRIENYQGNLQLIVEQFRNARAGTFDLADLLPHTTKDVATMRQAVLALCESVKNHHLAALLNAYTSDQKLMEQFCTAPAAMSFHHAFVGGLLEHTLNAMQVGDVVCGFYPGLNRDLVIAGIFLHDIAKTWELTYENTFGYSDGGQLVGHIVKSAIWVEQKAAEAQKQTGQAIPQELIDVMQHIILSHHGSPEFGAARIPSTPEAITVHYIEDLDAKLMMALSATRSENTTAEGNWTEYMKVFGGRLYRPDVAQADVAESGTPRHDTAPSGSERTASQRGAGGTAGGDSASGAATGSDEGALKITNPLFESTQSRKKP